MALQNEGDLQLVRNPYVNPSNVLKVKGFGYEQYAYLASYAYTIAAGGATTTILPLTGNLGGDLRFYRVEVYDGFNRVAGKLDLAARTTAFVINTTTLDPTSAWTLFFYGSEVTDGVEYNLDYKVELNAGSAASGIIGSTVPTLSVWDNVSLKLELTSSSDAAYTLFPAAGLVVKRGETVDFSSFSTASELDNAATYLFKVYIKKIGRGVLAASLPTRSTSKVFLAVTGTPSFPYAITKEYTELLSVLSLDATTAGTETDVLTLVLSNEGTTPSFSFTGTAVTGV